MRINLYGIQTIKFKLYLRTLKFINLIFISFRFIIIKYIIEKNVYSFTNFLMQRQQLGKKIFKNKIIYTYNS